MIEIIQTRSALIKLWPSSNQMEGEYVADAQEIIPFLPENIDDSLSRPD